MYPIEEQILLACNQKSYLLLAELNALNQLPLRSLSKEFLEDPRLNTLRKESNTLNLRFALERYLHSDRAPLYLEEVKKAFQCLLPQMYPHMESTEAYFIPIPLELRQNIYSLNESALTDLVQKISPEDVIYDANTPYKPRCNDILAARIMEASKKVAALPVRYITTELSVKNILDEALPSQHALRYGSSEYKEKIPAVECREIIIEFDLSKLSLVNPLAFYKQSNLENDLIQKIRQVPLSDNTLFFDNTGSVRNNTSTTYTFLQIFNKHLGFALEYYSALPKFSLISSNVKQMHEILTLNFFRFMDEMRDTTGKLVQTYTDNFYSQLEQLSDEQLILFLTDIKNSMTDTTEFSFYDAHLVDCFNITTITVSSKGYSLNLSKLINELEKGTLNCLREARVKIPDLFHSHRFLDHLLNQNLNTEVRLYLECLRKECIIANASEYKYLTIPEHFTHENLTTIVDSSLSDIKNVSVLFEDLSSIKSINHTKNHLLETLDYILTHYDTTLALSSVTENKKSEIREAVQIKRKEIEAGEQKALETLKHAKNVITFYVEQIKKFSFNFDGVKNLEALKSKRQEIEQQLKEIYFKPDLNHAINVLNLNGIPEPIQEVVDTKLIEIGLEVSGHVETVFAYELSQLPNQINLSKEEALLPSFEANNNDPSNKESPEKQEMKVLLKLIERTCSHCNYWKTKVRSGFGTPLDAETKIPQGISQILTMCQNFEGKEEDLLKNIGKLARHKYSSHFQWAHSFFRGRDDQTNNFYKTLAQLEGLEGSDASKEVIVSKVFENLRNKFNDAADEPANDFSI